MKREILINGGPRETRVAILEDDRLVELLVDRPDHRRTVGDIYLGRVEAVLPGIQAAFVDIGLEKRRSSMPPTSSSPTRTRRPTRTKTPRHRRSGAASSTEEARGRGSGGNGGRAGNGGNGRRRRERRGRRAGDPNRDAAAEPRQREVHPRRPLPNIQDLLKKGQTLPVQVTKEPISTKGCRVTAQISLPGRFLVYMPYASRVGVSRKIESREQRGRLREMVSRLCPRMRAA